MNLPKYEKVRQYVIDQMYRHLNSEEPIMSEREMCRVFGVTRTTVRKAVKVLIQEQVLIPKQGRGLFVNVEPYKNTFSRLKNMHKILLLTSRGHAAFYDSWYLNVIARLCAETARGVSLMNIGFLTGEPGTELEEIQMYYPDGVLWLRPDESRFRIIDELRKTIPVCTLLCEVRNDQFAVTVDYEKAGKMAAEWFMGRGLKKVAFFGKSGVDYLSKVLDNFFIGWKNAWLDAFGSFDENTVFSRNADFKAFFSSKQAKKVDGIFCHSNIFSGLAEDIADTRFAECPIMVDSDFYKLPPGVKIEPEAEIVLYPDKVFRMAIGNLTASLEKPGYMQSETVIGPSVKVLKNRKK